MPLAEQARMILNRAYCYGLLVTITCKLGFRHNYSTLNIVVQALMHAREYPLGLINVDEPRDLTLSPPLQPPRHRLAGPPSTWLTGDWQGTVSSLTFHPGV